MTARFQVRTVAHFDRLLKKLSKSHPDLEEHFAQAISILESDPYNHSRSYPIKNAERRAW